MSIKAAILHFTLKKARRKARKKQPWLGERFLVPRTGKSPVEVILYRPKAPCRKPAPVLFNVHGGAWVGGDATMLDTQSETFAERFGAFIVNINYTKVDEKPFPYMQEEVKDVVLFFSKHAEEYGLDPLRFTLIGYSAGGQVCAGVAMLLRDEGFRLNSQILCYPFLDFHFFDKENGELGVGGKTHSPFEEILFGGGIDRFAAFMSPAAAAPEAMRGLAPCELILCENDPLFPHGIAYRDKLTQEGVPIVVKQYPKAAHGFLEGSWPESTEPYDEEQRQYRDEAIEYLAERLKLYWNV